jgi:hypothetical protein
MMPNRNLVWALAILAVVLVVLPLFGMLGMMGMGGMMGPNGMMSMGGNMMGMHAVGFIWTLTAAVVVIALVVVLIRSVTRT